MQATDLNYRLAPPPSVRQATKLVEERARNRLEAFFEWEAEGELDELLS